MRISVSAGAIALGIALSCAANAQITTFTDRTTFNAAVGPTTVEDFGNNAQFPITTGVLNSATNLAVGYGPPIVPGEILPGVTYSRPVIGNQFDLNIDAGGGYAGGFLDGFNEAGVNPPLTITFNGPVQAFGFDTNGLMGPSFNIGISDSTGGYSNVISDSGGGFFGFESTSQDITSLTLLGNGSNTFAFDLDNFTWTAEATPTSATPEPGVYALLAAGGLSSLSVLRRRRNKFA